MSVQLCQCAHQNDSSHDQVAAVGKVHAVLHHVAHTDGGDHAIQHKADAADDAGGDGVSFAVAGVTINLSGLAVAAIAGILLNAILPGNDYEFDAADGSEAATSSNLQV